jgi:transcriptional regulator with XRE-family HTH domain
MASLPSARLLSSAKPKKESQTGAAPASSAEDGGEASKTNLGMRLKRIRTDSALTLQQVSVRTQVARSTLSKIENGQLSPTYDILQKIARGMEIDIVELFGANKADTPPARRSITKSRMGKKLATNEYLYEALATDLKHKQIFPLRTKIMARTFEEFGGWVRHDGEEFLFVLSGMVKVFTEFYTEEILETGDSIYFDSRMGHACVSVGEETAEVLWICTQISLDE